MVGTDARGSAGSEWSIIRDGSRNRSGPKKSLSMRENTSASVRKRVDRVFATLRQARWDVTVVVKASWTKGW